MTNEDKLAQALRRAERKLSAYVGVCAGDTELTNTILPMCREVLAAHERAQPASVADLQLTQLDRESLNYLGSALKHKPHAEAVDRALVICDHYARRAQLTICHQKLHERMLAAAPQPAKGDENGK